MDTHKLAEISAQTIAPGYLAKFVHSENMTLAFLDVEEGAILPEHSHPQEQINHVISGEFQLTIGDETQVCTSGTIAVIPANVKHSAKAITACKLLDIFYPVREDYR